MKQYSVTFLPDEISVSVDEGTSLLQAQIKAGLITDAPCGGKGTCGKCKVLLEGKEILSCQTPVHQTMTVHIPQIQRLHILEQGISVQTAADRTSPYVIAFDIGTTTVVACLLDGFTGTSLAQMSMINPQTAFGADVISRIQYALQDMAALKDSILSALTKLIRDMTAQAGITPADIGTIAIAGNTAMHHLALGIDPKPLVTPPYMPSVYEALEIPSVELLPVCPEAIIRILPNIAGFVGGDTIACMAATRFDQLEPLTLMIDIGTNGEMVLGRKGRRIACSTAAGPAFEGAKISSGMRGTAGAIDHVWMENGQVCCHVIGDTKAKGLCGSGLLDLTSVLLELEIIDESGSMDSKEYTIPGTCVTLTQKDVREVQLAKAAIRAGIQLLTDKMDIAVSDIQQVYLAGAFGNYLSPASACRIGMIPPCLLNRIKPIGNAAGEGAKLCALNRREFEYSKKLALETEFLELAALPQFQDCYVDALMFDEEDA